ALIWDALAREDRSPVATVPPERLETLWAHLAGVCRLTSSALRLAPPSRSAPLPPAGAGSSTHRCGTARSVRRCRAAVPGPAVRRPGDCGGGGGQAARARPATPAHHPRAELGVGGTRVASRLCGRNRLSVIQVSVPKPPTREPKPVGLLTGPLQRSLR